MIKCFVIFDTINHIIFLEDLRGPSTGKAGEKESGSYETLAALLP